MVLSLQRGKLVKNQSGSQLTSSTTLASSENSSKERGRGWWWSGNEKGANSMFGYTVFSKVTNG